MYNNLEHSEEAAAAAGGATKKSGGERRMSIERLSPSKDSLLQKQRAKEQRKMQIEMQGYTFTVRNNGAVLGCPY